MNFEFDIAAGDFTRAGTASSDFKNILKQLNVPAAVIKRTIVSLYEAEVNVVAHAEGGGKVLADVSVEKIHIRVVDKGPGIPDIDQAMEVGFSTATPKVREMGFGAGMGLPNMKKNSDLLTVTSSAKTGTTVEIVNNL